MPNYIVSKLFRLEDVPEFQRFQANNPQNKINENQTAIMFGRAIHWMSFLNILWPNFEKENYYYVDVGYIVWNDPDREKLPHTFYQQIAEFLKTFWTIQLADLFPKGDWDVMIDDSGIEIIVQAAIRDRGSQ